MIRFDAITETCLFVCPYDHVHQAEPWLNPTLKISSRSPYDLTFNEFGSPVIGEEGECHAEMEVTRAEFWLGITLESQRLSSRCDRYEIILHGDKDFHNPDLQTQLSHSKIVANVFESKMLELNSKPGSQSCDLRFDIDHQAELRLNSTLQSKLVSSRSTGSNEGEVIKVQIQVFCYESMLLDSMEYSTNRRFCPAFMEFHRFGYLLCEGECPRITYASEIILLHLWFVSPLRYRNFVKTAVTKICVNL